MSHLFVQCPRCLHAYDLRALNAGPDTLITIRCDVCDTVFDVRTHSKVLQKMIETVGFNSIRKGTERVEA